MRRSKVVKGFVNFPVDDPSYKNTTEGGMFVRLVVIPNKDYDSQDRACCGGFNHVIMDESLQSGEHERDLLEQHSKYQLKHFPRCATSDEDPYHQYLSIGYHAVITIGSTGWSGWSDEKERYWLCSYEDLTPEGKAIYDSMLKLYPNATVELQTWLDT